MKFRNFNFRAYDTKEKSYVDFKLTSNGSIGIDINAYPHIEIELWSGCVDSCGKHIFEGDIVESITPAGDTFYFWVCYVGLGREPKVERIEKGTSKHYKSNIDEMKGEFDVEECEYTNSLRVVGNIHDNAEFLRKDKECN